jgi:hypothetical protein
LNGLLGNARPIYGPPRWNNVPRDQLKASVRVPAL